jgi:hypothetical protein
MCTGRSGQPSSARMRPPRGRAEADEGNGLGANNRTSARQFPNDRCFETPQTAGAPERGAWLPCRFGKAFPSFSQGELVARSYSEPPSDPIAASVATSRTCRATSPWKGICELGAIYKANVWG